MTNDGCPDKSAFSSENVLNRLSASRAQASKDANRLFLAALIFAGLFLIKASGLRVDITMLDTNVANVPHGLFFFLVASQVSMIFAYMRSADVVSIDSRLKEALLSFGIEDVHEAERSFVNEAEWFTPTSADFSRKDAGPLSTAIFRVTTALSSITGMSFYMFPGAAGIYVLVNHEAMITTGNLALQFWTVFASTLLSIFWFVAFIAVWAVMRK